MLPFRIAIADLVIGASCAGCGRPAITLCEDCSTAFLPRPREAWPRPTPAMLLHPTRIVPIASGSHAGVLRSALARYKEEGQFGLLRILAHMLAASVVRAAPREAPIALVPVPSSRLTNLRRGHDAIGELSRSAAAELRGIGLDCSAVNALRRSRRVADQSGLSAAARIANVAEALELRSSPRLRGRDIVIVDDILTTGSTVSEAVRVLSLARSRPVGVAVIAATERRS